jgi:hypothetical protein
MDLFCLVYKGKEMSGWRKRQISDKYDYDTIKAECDNMLKAMIGSDEFVKQWWNSSNMAFELKTPQELFESGRDGQSEVYSYLSHHAYGGEYS